MRIRWKLLILLLAIALLPLGFLSCFDHRSMQRLGGDIGSELREDLIDRAGEQLLQLAENYGAIVRQEAETIELLLHIQAREAERVLAAAPPETIDIFWGSDYDEGQRLPEGMTTSTKHVRANDSGQRQQVEVTYERQVFLTAPGVDRESVAADVARLSRMTPMLKFLQRQEPQLLHWQYTATDAGIHTSYPGHGGYPPDFDPRARQWYRSAMESDEQVWNPPYVDASTREVVLTASVAIRNPEGTKVGVTAIDVQLTDFVHSVEVPSAWSTDARTMIVGAKLQADGKGNGLVIFAQRSYEQERQSWNLPIELQWLQSADAAEFQKLVEDIRSGKSGLRKMAYDGRDSLWAYGPVNEYRSSALVVIAPYDQIVVHADRAEDNVLQQTTAQVQTASTTLIVVVVILVIVAIFGSRTITRPVAELARAASSISGGNFRDRANIVSNDEFGDLGKTFNEMVPQLQDRIRLRESLSLAMEVQQGLLPAGPPTINGLDIFGRSIYCDETGGDYYDFVELAELGDQRVGIAVGDVTGHGIAAALLMATARALLRIRASQAGSLAEMLSDINRQLSADTAGDRFMTLFYMLIDGKHRTLRWVCAGHDPPITYDPASGAFGELHGGGIPLGIEGTWQYDEQAGTGVENQIILIGTDGIWEARNGDDQMFGKDALRELIRNHADQSAEAIGKSISTALHHWCANLPQQDDITFVVVKFRPVDGS